MWFLFLLLLVSPAASHSWYSLECCSEKDCRPVDKSEVLRTPEGWSIPAQRTLIPFSDSRIKPSLDVNMHICQNSARIICLYIPDPGI